MRCILFLIVLSALVGCTPPADPAVGRWYGRVGDPESEAKDMIARMREIGEEPPPLEVVAEILDESRYELTLEADGTGTFANSSCQWRRDVTNIVIDLGSSDDGPEVITLSWEGEYLLGDGYEFAPILGSSDDHLK